jgi:hypothetical protein
MTWHEDRDRILHSRINELGLHIEGSELEPLIQQLYHELEQSGVAFKPPIYLSDEWGCPEGVPMIAVPFYLTHPTLQRIEQEIADHLETAEESMMYLRHEAGHAFNYAYVLYESEEWHRIFGPYSRPYLESYKPNPFSRDYVRHVSGWYAQKHPDEDFAETFAVWLTPGSKWREEYAGTGALRKLEYVDRLMREIGSLPPKVRPSLRDVPIEEMAYTVADYYKSRRQPRIEIPRWFDGDLRQLFEENGDPAGPLLRLHRTEIMAEVTYWTGVPTAIVRSLVDHLLERVEALALCVKVGEPRRYLISFTVMVTTLALNYLHHSSFVPERR